MKTKAWSQNLGHESVLTTFSSYGDVARHRQAEIIRALDKSEQQQPAAHVIALEQNYRSTQPILDACNQVIRFAKERYTKNLRSDRRSKQKPFLTTVTDEAAQARF